MDGWKLLKELGDDEVENKQLCLLPLTKAGTLELYFRGNIWFDPMPRTYRIGVWMALIIMEIWDPESWRFFNEFGPELLEYLDDGSEVTRISVHDPRVTRYMRTVYSAANAADSTKSCENFVRELLKGLIVGNILNVEEAKVLNDCPQEIKKKMEEMEEMEEVEEEKEEEVEEEEEEKEVMEIKDIGGTDFSQMKRKNSLFLEEVPVKKIFNNEGLSRQIQKGVSLEEDKEKKEKDFFVDRLPYDMKLTLDEALIFMEVDSERKWSEIFKAGDFVYERSGRADGKEIKMEDRRVKLFLKRMEKTAMDQGTGVLNVILRLKKGHSDSYRSHVADVINRLPIKYKKKMANEPEEGELMMVTSNKKINKELLEELFQKRRELIENLSELEKLIEEVMKNC